MNVSYDDRFLLSNDFRLFLHYFQKKSLVLATIDFFLTNSIKVIVSENLLSVSLRALFAKQSFLDCFVATLLAMTPGGFSDTIKVVNILASLVRLTTDSIGKSLCFLEIIANGCTKLNKPAVIYFQYNQ